MRQIRKSGNVLIFPNSLFFEVILLKRERANLFRKLSKKRDWLFRTPKMPINWSKDFPRRPPCIPLKQRTTTTKDAQQHISLNGFNDCNYIIICLEDVRCARPHGPKIRPDNSSHNLHEQQSSTKFVSFKLMQISKTLYTCTSCFANAFKSLNQSQFINCLLCKL